MLVSLRAPKRKLNRYDRKGFALLPRILEAIGSQGSLIELRKSNQRGIASSFSPTPLFVKELKRFRWKPEHFSWETGAETIRLSVTHRNFATRSKTIELVDYAESAETSLLRKQIASINTSLRNSNIKFLDDDGPPVLTTHRDLVRHFKTLDPNDQRFDLNGRLFGGWWQELPSSRRSAIRIDGENIADLDFASAFLRLAYCEVGAKAPEGDLYSRIRGVNAERYRDGLKQIISAMLFRETPLLRIPSELKDHLPRDMTGTDIRSAVLAAYPELSDIFESGAGLRLMFRESQILVRTLLMLVEMDICGLGMHDGIMVPLSKRKLAEAAMAEASMEITGVRLPITLKSLHQ